jgi:hypothetical protein
MSIKQGQSAFTFRCYPSSFSSLTIVEYLLNFLFFPRCFSHGLVFLLIDICPEIRISLTNSL